MTQAISREDLIIEGNIRFDTTNLKHNMRSR
jgi:hypothetical protein